MEQKLADELILAVARGDMRALETLYYEMYHEIYCYLLTLVHDSHDAEDIAQDTFVRVYKYAPKFFPVGKGKSWIYKIAERLALTYLKNDNTAAESLTNDMACSSNAEEQAINSQAVASAISRLSDSERQIVTLHAVSGLTLSEIAEIVGLPLGTVKWKHSEALKKLRKFLGRDFL